LIRIDYNMSEWVSIADREEFKDLTPIGEFSSQVEIGKIAYSSQCKFKSS